MTDVFADALSEYYYGDSPAPHEALGRAARELSRGGALYLGGGVGIEKQTSKTGEKFVLSQASGGKSETFSGPLSAAMRGFSVAGGSTAPDTPGGAQQVTDPAAAARLRELDGRERECEKDIQRYTRRLAARPPSNGMPSIPSASEVADDRWEARRIAELRVELAQLHAERAQLLAAGKVTEAETGKPGTNWKQVTPKNRKTVNPLVAHYKKQAKPFTACVNDNRKRFGADAEKVCAVVKDMGERSTKWRKGGSKKLAEAAAAAGMIAAVEDAARRLEAIDAQFGAGACVELAESAGGYGDVRDAIGEQAFTDLGTLFVCGHSFGTVWQQVREEATLTPEAEPVQEAGGLLGSMLEAFAPTKVAVPVPESVAGAQKARGAKVGSNRAPTGTGGSKYDDKKHPRGAKGTTSGGKFVKSGSAGEDVRAVQAKVGVKRDGQFGSMTANAVRDFQRRHGLKVDGVVGHQTALALAGKYSAARRAPTGELQGSDKRALQAARQAEAAARAARSRGRAPDRRAGGETTHPR